MNIAELITAVGADTVQFQNLDQCAIDLKYSAKSGSKITFGTEQPIGLNGTDKLGLVVWLDRKAVADAIAKARSDQHSAGGEG